MTLQDAITALLHDFHLESFEEVYRDEAKADDSFTGFSWEHPKVQRFREICRVLREVTK